MRIKKLFGIDGAKQATGITIIIDIFRAASTAAYLLDKGVKKIFPVATKEEAFKLQKKYPKSVLVGEENGYKIRGFDYGNSPSEINKLKSLKGKTVIFRTTMGTQGIVHAKQAKTIIFGSFVTASTVLNYLNNDKQDQISVVALDDGEDDIFANYLVDKLNNKTPQNIKQIIDFLKKHPNAARFLNPNLPEFPEEDFYLCLELDRFHFVPLVQDGSIIKAPI